MSEKDRKLDFEEAYNQAWSGWSSWQEVAKSDLNARLKWAYTQDDLRRFKVTNRDPLTFPQIRRCLKLLSGYQRKNRLSLKYEPVEGGDVQTAAQLTAVVLWLMQFSNGYNVISDAFEGAMNTGLNLVNIFNDRYSNTRFKRLAYNQFLLHPGFTEKDLSDCQYGILRSHVTKEQAKMLYAGRESEIDKIVAKEGADGKFPNLPNHKIYGEYLLTLTEWQHRTSQRHKYFNFNGMAGPQMAGEKVLGQDGRPVEWKGTKDEANAILGQTPFIDLIEEWENTVEVTCFLEDVEVANEIDPWGIGDFSFTPIFAYFDSEADDMTLRVQSMVRGLKDFQRADDRRIMSLLSMIEQAAGPGLDYEEGTLIDQNDAFVTGAGKPRMFEKGALSENRTRDRQPPDVPMGQIQLHEMLSRLMPTSVNINEEMLGMPENPNLQIAGVLAKLRASAGLVGLFDIFDNLSLAHKFIGHKTLRLVQQYPLNKVLRVLNERPTNEFFSQNFGKYDCVPAEGILTDSQRSLAYTELIQLEQMGAKMGKPLNIPWSHILKYVPISISTELIKIVEQNEQTQAKSAEKQQQMADSLQMLVIAQAKQALQEGQSQMDVRKTEEMENVANSILDRAKTITEVQKTQRDYWFRAMELAIELEKMKQPKLQGVTE